MRHESNDWDDDPDNWDEEPNDWDEEEDDETPVLPCPSCGADVFEDAEQCPRCGEYIIRRLRAWEGKPRWWIVLGLIGIGAVVWALALR